MTTISKGVQVTNLWSALKTLLVGTFVVSRFGFAATISLIISTHSYSALVIHQESFSAFWASSKFMKMTPTKKFRKKNVHTKIKIIKKYEKKGAESFFGPIFVP